MVHGISTPPPTPHDVKGVSGGAQKRWGEVLGLGNSIIFPCPQGMGHADMSELGSLHLYGLYSILI